MRKPYEYQRPPGKEHVISIRKWNRAFANRGRWPFIRCHAFICRDTGIAEIHFYYTVWAKVVMMLLFPAFIVVDGFSSAVEAVRDCWFQRTRGTFSGDEASSGSEDWDKLLKLAGSKDGR